MSRRSISPHDPLRNHRRVCLAPMMDVTDRHFRFFCRLLSQHSLLYSEMVTTGAVLHGPRERLLAFSPAEQPVACQLGGNDPEQLAECAKIAEDYGYDEVNLNVGCPSDRVQAGRFGACLMAEPQLVAECLQAMQNAVSIPVTIKTRIGIDQQDSYEAFAQFVETIKAAGTQIFIVHARKAWLQGLNAKQNRTVPPLIYDYVYRIKAAHPELTVIINGGIQTVTDVQTHLAHVDGVMIGRELQRNPMLLTALEQTVFDNQSAMPSQLQILEQYASYCYQQAAAGASMRNLIKPLYGLFLGVAGARDCRRQLNALINEKHFSLSAVKQQFAGLGAYLQSHLR